MAEPISLADAKRNLRDTPDEDDALIGTLIVAARQHVENETGLVLTQRTVTETAPALGTWIDLASWPVTSVDAIRYPLAGVMTVLTPGSWLTSYRKRPVRLIPATWGWGIGMQPCWTPALPVEIDVTAGWAPDDVPAPVREAMLLLVSHWYSNRDAAEVGARAAAVEVPFGVEVLLRPYRLLRV